MSAAENPVDLDALRDRIAAALGWSAQGVRSFSLAMLRDLVRPKNAKLADEIGGVIQRGEHLFQRVPRSGWRRR